MRRPPPLVVHGDTTAEGSATRTSFTGWWLYAPSPLTGTLFGLLAVTGPELRAATGLGYGGLAVIFVAQTLGTVGGAIVAGISAARMFRPVPMCALAAAGLGGASLVDGPAALALLMVLAGFGCYAINVRAQADLSLLTRHRRARALGLFHLFGGLGSFVFPFFVALAFYLGAGWHVPFAAVAVLFGAFGVVSLMWAHTGDPPGLRLDALRRVIHGRAGAALIVGCLGTGLLFAVPLWIPTLMRDRFDWSTAASSVSAGVYMLALLVSRIVSTALVTRVGGRVILVTSASLVVLGHVALFVAWTPAVMLGAAVAIGGGAGPLLPVGIARVAHGSRDDRLGTSVVMTLAALSQIALPATVVGAHAAGLSLQHAASLTIVPALVVLVAATRA